MKTNDPIALLANGDLEGFKSVIEADLYTRLNSRLDEMKHDIAQNLFNEEEICEDCDDDEDEDEKDDDKDKKNPFAKGKKKKKKSKSKDDDDDDDDEEEDDDE